VPAVHDHGRQVYLTVDKSMQAAVKEVPLVEPIDLALVPATVAQRSMDSLPAAEPGSKCQLAHSIAGADLDA